MTPAIAAILSVLPNILDRVLPNQSERQRAQEELAKIAVNGEIQQMVSQMEVNKVEAASESMFVAGWRPFVGWMCGIGFAYATIGHVMLSWLSGAMGWGMPPSIDADVLTTTLWGMLGLGSLRTVEKIKGATQGSK